MSRKNILRVLAIIVVAVVAVGVFIAQMTTPKAAEPSVEQKSGYSTITSVAGCTFMVNSAFTDQATAVTQISEGINFDRQGFYSYKNGTDQYMLFQLDGIVVAVEKGTSFNFDDYKEKEEALNNSSIMGIWFGTDKDGIKYDKKGDRSESTVTAQVVITNDLYNDFIGKLICYEKDGEEWSMFVGIPGTRYKEIGKEAKNGIDSIAETFHLSDNSGEFTEPEYAVVISGNNAGQVVEAEEIEVKEEVAPVSEPHEETSEITTEETTVSEDTSADEAPDEPVVTDVPDETPVEEEQEETSEEIVPEVKPAQSTVSVKSTVRDNASDDKAYTSSIYSMLGVGKSSIYDVKTGTGDGKTQLIAKLCNIQDSKTTSDLLYQALLTDFTEIIAYDAPPGCHWESAVFDIKANGASVTPYTDVRFVGADGKALKFRGIKYSTRTYDLGCVSDDGEWVKGYTVYYAVPNGCTEYVLRVGDGDDINGWQSAYYYVER